MTPEQQEFAQLVSEAHAALQECQNSTSSEVWQRACLSATKLLTNSHFPDDFHWFCDRTWAPFARQSLMMLSIPSVGADILYQKVRTQLARCYDCAKVYHRQKEELSQMLLDDLGLTRDKVDEFKHSLDDRDRKRVVLQLASQIVDLGSDKLSIDQLKASLVECMIVPSIMFDSADSMYNFKKLLLYIDEKEPEIFKLDDNVYPSVVILLFGNDSDLHLWARKRLAQLDSLLPSVSLALNSLILKLEQPTEDRMVVLFLMNFGVFAEHCSGKALSEFFSARKPSLLHVIMKRVLKNSPLFILQAGLKLTEVLLRKMGIEAFMANIEPTPLSELAIIFGNSNFARASTNDVSVDATYDKDLVVKPEDMFNWLHVFENQESADGFREHRTLFSLITSIFQLYVKLSAGLTEKSNELYLFHIYGLIAAGLKVEFQQTSVSFVSQTDYLMRADLYNFISTNALFLVNRIKTVATEKSVYLIGLQMIGLSVRYEIALDMASMHEKQIDLTASANSGNSMSIWKAVNQLNSKFLDPGIAIVLLGAIGSVVFLSRVPSNADNISSSLTNAAETLRILSEMNEKVLQIICLDEARDENGVLSPSEFPLTALILLSFSSNTTISQSAVDTLTMAFDPLALDRAECFRKMITECPKLTLTAISYATKLVLHLKLFSPVPGVLKISQDMLEALYDPRTGAMNSEAAQKLENGTQNELLNFWNSNWYFLKFTIQNTKMWSKSYPTSLMLEVVRDQLDYCHDLLEKFRFFEADIANAMKECIQLSSEIGKEQNLMNETGSILAKPAIDSVVDLCGLLRLRDEKLIDSSSANIKTILSLMKSFHVSVPTAVVNLFIDYATRNVKSNMTEEMMRQLLLLTGALNTDKVEEIVQQGRAKLEGKTVQTNSKDASNISLRPSASSAQPSPAVNNLQPLTGGSFIRSKTVPTQRTLFDYGKLVPGRAVPPPPVKSVLNDSEPTRVTQMDLVRQKLAEARKVPAAVPKPAPLLGKPVSREIHPSRPAGFNTKARPTGSVSIQVNPRSRHFSKEHDSSSDDSDEDGLFAIGSKKKDGPKANSEGSKSRAATFSSGPRLSQKEIDEKNMRARMNIDMNPLYKKILSWDYFKGGQYPIKEELAARTYKPVPSQFKSVAEYQEIFEPLLLLECWQQMAQNREAGQPRRFRLDVGKRVRCDDFYDVYGSVSREIVSKERLSDTDIILISCSSDFSNLSHVDSTVPHCFAKVLKVSMSKTTGDFADLTLRVFEPPSGVMSRLSQGSIISAIRVMSLVTIEREYASLKGLPFYELKDSIIKGEPSPISHSIDSVRLEHIMKYNEANEAQAKSIIHSVDTDGFSLILGPPGTGKTKTILGIVGAYLGGKNNPKVQQQQSGKAKRILLCAPSNAAVDELVLRLKRGVYNQSNQKFVPDIVRIGRSEAVNSSVRDVTLEEIVERELGALDSKSSNNPEHLREQQANVTARLSFLKKSAEERGAHLTEDELVKTQDEIRECIKQLKEFRRQQDIRREEMVKETRMRDFSRRQIQDQKLESAQIVCATLSGSSHGVLASLMLQFDAVIIDEAAQSIELSSLIPLKYGCRKCVMVGDPNQLPPTVLSQAAANLNYEKSLFVRMYNQCKSRVHLLNVQFRMHPDIAKFPSEEFYHGEVTTGATVKQMTARPWHRHVEFAPYRFFSVKGRESSGQLSSFFNEKEAQLILEMYSTVTQLYPKLSDKVGIISPYKRQIDFLRNIFRKKYGASIFDWVDFNTVDGFQGQEKELIIVSCVRADETKGVGFLKDRRRLNVAITRAQCSLWVVGHASHLQQSPIWKRMIDDAKERNMFAQVHPGFLKNRVSEMRTPDNEDSSSTSGSVLPDDIKRLKATPPQEFRKQEYSADFDGVKKQKKAYKDIKKRKREENFMEAPLSAGCEVQKAPKKPKTDRAVMSQPSEGPKDSAKQTETAISDSVSDQFPLHSPRNVVETPPNGKPTQDLLKNTSSQRPQSGAHSHPSSSKMHPPTGPAKKKTTLFNPRFSRKR